MRIITLTPCSVSRKSSKHALLFLPSVLVELKRKGFAQVRGDTLSSTSESVFRVSLCLVRGPVHAHDLSHEINAQAGETSYHALVGGRNAKAQEESVSRWLFRAAREGGLVTEIHSPKRRNHRDTVSGCDRGFSRF